MYLVSIFEKDGVVEASLGGRVTANEICVLAQEISETFEELSDQPFSLLLDYSRAKRFDPKSLQALNELKDLAFEYGVAQIVSVAPDEGERTLHQTSRLQQVLEGREKFVPAGTEHRLLAAEHTRQLQTYLAA
jgi:hypothetical protein